MGTGNAGHLGKVGRERGIASTHDDEFAAYDSFPREVRDAFKEAAINMSAAGTKKVAEFYGDQLPGAILRSASFYHKESVEDSFKPRKSHDQPAKGNAPG